MSLYKRGTVWWTRFTISGQRIRESTGTEDKGLAEQYEARMKTQLYKELELGAKPQRTWEQAVVRWLNENATKTSLETDKSRLRWMDTHLKGMPLTSISRDFVDRLILARQQPSRGSRGQLVKASPATVNRMLALLRAILRRAEREWEWIDKAPTIRLLKEPDKRVRWLTPEEAVRLIRELPEHQREAVIFELETGLRMSNVAGLQWSQVDMSRQCAWKHADQVKTKRAIAIPLTRLAMDVLARQIGKHDEYVFTWRGKPIKQLNTAAWRKAKRRAGIDDFRWHDLRHTWASWHAQSGTPMHVLKELGGWNSQAMVDRYAHLSGGHLLEHAERRNVVITSLAHK